MNCKSVIGRSLSSRIVLFFLMCSIFFAIIGAYFHIILEHKNEFDYINANSNRIQVGRNELLARAIEIQDIKSLEIHVKSIPNIIYGIEYVAVLDNKSKLVEYGAKTETLKFVDIPLIHDVRVGCMLVLGFNTSKIKLFLIKDVALIFILHITISLMLSVFIFIYVRRYVVGPLKTMARNVESTDLFVDRVDSLNEFIDRGDEIGCVARSIDIMRLKLRESIGELRKSRDYNRILIDNVPVAALVVANGKIIFCNKSAKELFFADSCKSLLETDFMSYIDHDSKLLLNSCHDELMSAIDCKECVECGCDKAKKMFSIVIRDTLGIEKYVELIFVKNDDCKREATLVFLKDMTQSVILQEEKDVLNQRMNQAQKMEALGTLAGGISHDFNNVLTGILGYAELIKFRTEEDETRKNIGYIIDAGRRSKELIEQLLIFCRSDSNTKKTSTQLDRVLKEALKLLRSTVPPMISFNKFIDKVSNVKVSAIQIHQVIMNLCTNAVHAIQHSDIDAIGEITIALSDVYLTNDDIKLLPNISAGSFVKLTVADNGSGMSQDIMDRIFEPCFTTKSLKRGTGMGLSVVYGIIDSYDGCIIVDSELGKGTQFIIYLPVTKDLPDNVVEDVDNIIVIGRSNILIVDDEELIVNVLKSFLEEFGYAVHIEKTPEAALEYFSMHHSEINCVITDLMMPGMTGVTMTEMFQDINPEMLIIWCTGFLSHKLQSDAQRLGIVEVLHKPVDGYVIAKAIQKYLT